MRKFLCFLMVAVLACTMVFANGGSESTDGPLRVGTMAKAMGLPLKYAADQGYFSEKGLEGELDVAVSGMANVYNLATGNYTYIADTMISEKGQALYVRPDSAIAQNPEKDGIIGSAETVKGMSILGPLSTSAQYNAIKYVESFGLTSDDFQMVSMEYPQAYQAFLTGEGDGIATIPPYSFQLEQAGMVNVASIATLMGQPLCDGIYVQNELVDTRRDDLQILVEGYYRASKELVEDEELRKQVAMEWYAEEGITYSESDMENEILAQTYTTEDQLKDAGYEFGTTMTTMGNFFSTQGLIDVNNLGNIESSLDPSFVEEMIGQSVNVAQI